MATKEHRIMHAIAVTVRLILLHGYIPQRIVKRLTMISADKAIDVVIGNEGGLVENVNDSGGITKYGISLRFLKSLIDVKKYGIYTDPVTADDIRNLTLDQARAIYKGEFWDHMSLDKLATQKIANYIFDMAVNIGIAPAIKIAQRACWAVMQQYNCIIDDGVMGDKTIAMINKCDFNLLYAMRSERAGYYHLIVNEHKQDAAFIDGWNRRAYET